MINFILNDSAEGGKFEARYGEFYEGDGQQTTISGNVGMPFPFTGSGFTNLSFEYGNTDPTDRSIQRSDAQALIDGGDTFVKNPAQVWGQPETKDDLKLIVYLGVDINDRMNFYGFGNYQSKEVEGGFFYRNPDTRSGVFANGDQRLVGDLDTTNNLDCPNVAVGDAAGLALVMDNSTAIGAECFVFNEMFPGGFSPRFGGELTDYSAVAGLRGEFASGLVWDVSTSIGYNDVDFFIRNTVNASLGPDTPTEFDPGAYTQREQNFNIDLAYPVGISWMSSDLSIAGGFEYREEEFEITRGDLVSYEIGSPARRDAALSVGPEVLPGLQSLARSTGEKPASLHSTRIRRFPPKLPNFV
ncbi:MAG: hypothetical protein P8Y45_21630 [Exilibacterium sp.]